MLDNSNILVTGGSGFVGRNLTRNLLKKGKDVLIVDNLASGDTPETWLPDNYAMTTTEKKDLIRYTSSEDTNGELQFLRTDIRPFFNDYDALFFDEVYHLAAVIGGRSTIEGEPLKVGSDLSIDAEFFNWAIQAEPGKILYASSSAAYPIHLQNGEETRKLKEEDISFENSVGIPDMTYGWSKLTGEYLGQIAAQDYGLSVAAIRPLSGYGGEQSFNYPVPSIAKRAVNREDPLTVWGSGEQVRDFVHIEDVVDAMQIAIENISDGSGINIGTGKPTDFFEVAETFSDIVGYNPEIKNLPEKPEGVGYRCADTTRMKEVLDWKPEIELEEGFARVVDAVEKRTSQ